jgi:hypothetical protein
VDPRKTRVVFPGKEPGAGGEDKTTGRRPRTRYVSSRTSLIARETEVGSDDDTIQTSSPVNIRPKVFVKAKYRKRMKIRF